VQPYLPEIETIGDLRILSMNRRILGCVLRKPKKGGRLGNLHLGATAHPFTPTARQLAAAKTVADDLAPKGLYLLGLDFIGDYLTEVNITCPSAARQINQVSGTHVEVALIDELEQLRQK